MKTKSQKYSDIVFNRVSDYVNNSTDDSSRKRKYKGLCKRAGGVMRTVGLIQFITFLLAKTQNEPQHGMLLNHLRYELVTLDIVTNANDVNSLVQRVRMQSLPNYMRTTTEVLRLLQWHKRISDILIEGTVDENGGD